MKDDFPGAVPEIPVSTIEAAAAYYRDRLGWKLHGFIVADPDGNLFRVFYDFAWETGGR